MTRRSSLGRLTVGLTCLLCLGGCFLPDQFEATIQVGGGGDYRLSFAGEIVDVLAVAERAEGRRTRNDHEAQRVLESLRAAPGMTRSERIGLSRYDIAYETRGVLAPNETVAFPPTARPFIVLRRAGDEMIIESVSLSEREARLLRRLGLRMRGELRVSMTREPSAHNADGEPGLFDKSYRWSFRNVDDKRPFLTAPMDAALSE